MTDDQQEAVRQQAMANIMEQVLVVGDLKVLSASQRQMYYLNVCQSLGLNPMTRPFEYITVQGRTLLYARRDATDQLRKIHTISVDITSREKVDDVYVVTARAHTPDGREDEAIGAVSLAGLRGEALANAFMKAETKAKRRVTLSIVGLGWLDESETESMLTAGVAKALPEPRKKTYEEMTTAEKMQVLGGTWTKRWQEADKKGYVETYELEPISPAELTLEALEAFVKAIGSLLKASTEDDIAMEAAVLKELISHKDGQGE